MANKIYPMGLIIASLVILVLPGILFNNFTASGLNPAFALSCGTFPDNANFSCHNSNASGCQSTPSACTLSGNSISFLNQASPFTQLISGNIFVVFSALTSNGNVNRGPFDPSGGGNFYTADCYVTGITAGASQNITTTAFSQHISACTQTNPDRSNMTKYTNGQSSCATPPCSFQTFTWGDWNYNLLNVAQVLIPFYHLSTNATYALTCYNQGYWFVTGQPTVGYSMVGCDYYIVAGYSPPANPNVNPVYSFLLAIPCNAPGTGGCKAQTYPTGNSHMEIFIQPENWDTQFCTNAFSVTTHDQSVWYGSQQCVNFETWFTAPKASNFGVGFFVPFLTILLGIILFMLGTGINIQAGGSIFGTGTTFGAGVNAQGTRLAQILGVTLIVFTPLYSEFSTWFTSGILPYGLDGGFVSIATGSGIISFVIAAMLFGGVIWQALSGTTGQ